MLYRRYNQMMPHEAFIRSQMAWDSPSLTHIGGEGRQTLVDRAPDDPISVAPGCAPRSNSPSASAAVVEAFRKVPAERRASVLIDLFHSTVPPDYGGFFVDRSKSEADQREQVLFELDGLVNAQSIGFAVEMIPLMYPYLQTLEGKDRYLEVLDVGSRTGAGAALLADIFMSYHSRLPTYVDTIDIDPTFHEYRSSRWPRLRQNLVGDVFSLSAKSYDIIVCSHTVEHLSEPIPFCRKLQAVAKNWVFIYCPYNEINPIPGHHTVNDALIDQLMPVEKRILPSWWWRPKGEPAECVFVVLPAD
jgi:SAM-dependent methyltransferase